MGSSAASESGSTCALHDAGPGVLCCCQGSHALAPTGAVPLHMLPTTRNWTAVQGGHVNGHSDGSLNGANGVGNHEVDLESGEAAPALHSSGDQLSWMPALS